MSFQVIPKRPAQAGPESESQRVKTFKRHLTVANVLSVIALFVALSASAVAATRLGTGQVKAVNIASQAVTNAKIKTQAVTSGKIKNSGINAQDLAPGSVINSKLKNKAVTNAKLGNEAVGTSKLAKKAVTANILGPEAVTAGKLGGESVSAAKLSASFYLQLLKNVTYVTKRASTTPRRQVGHRLLPGRQGSARRRSADQRRRAAQRRCGAERIGPGGQRRTTAGSGGAPAGREVGSETASWQVVAYAICAEL